MSLAAGIPPLAAAAAAAAAVVVEALVVFVELFTFESLS